MGRYDFRYPDPEEGDDVLPNEVTTLETILGETVIWFEELDEQLSTAISFLLRRGDDVGRVVSAELPFRAKVNLLEALFRQDRPKSGNLDLLRDLAAACSQIEEKRNQVIHSKWHHSLDGHGLTRSKFTARGKHGLRRHTENLSFRQAQAIWAHCGYLAHSLDELMFVEYGEEYGQP
jgi:hypothetical protein